MRPRRSDQEDLPNFGPDQFYLTFTVQPQQAGGLVLAEPIRFGPFPTRLPVVPLSYEGRRQLFFEFSGTVLSQVSPEQSREYRYRQVAQAGDPNRIVAESSWPNVNIVEHLSNLPPSLHDPLQDWTIALLRRLSQQSRYRLPDSTAPRCQADPTRHSDHTTLLGGGGWRLLTDYLANSGEYTYTLEIARHDQQLDPVLDFLINTRQGHCERFAAALALMLRWVRIPARVVKGYRGCESQGHGKYVVRHSHAHAWVEMLAPRSPTTNGAGVSRQRNLLMIG